MLFNHGHSPPTVPLWPTRGHNCTIPVLLCWLVENTGEKYLIIVFFLTYFNRNSKNQRSKNGWKNISKISRKTWTFFNIKSFCFCLHFLSKGRMYVPKSLISLLGVLAPFYVLQNGCSGKLEKYTNTVCSLIKMCEKGYRLTADCGLWRRWGCVGGNCSSSTIWNKLVLLPSLPI